MNFNHSSTTVSRKMPRARGFSLLPNGQHGQPELAEENLPFTVKVVCNEDDLDRAVFVRHAAYGRHIPTVAALLEKPEPCDTEPGCIVLLAESKFDGAPLGTMRIQTNQYRSLALEQSITLPPWLNGAKRAEATRLGVTNNRIGRLVKTALFKAYFHYCLLDEVEWMVIVARAPLDRQYEALLFQDVAASGEFIPMRHVGNIPHRVLAFNVPLAEHNWRRAHHPLYDFVFNTHHADIDLRGLDQLSAAGRGNPKALSIKFN